MITKKEIKQRWRTAGIIAATGVMVALAGYAYHLEAVQDTIVRMSDSQYEQVRQHLGAEASTADIAAEFLAHEECYPRN